MGKNSITLKLLGIITAIVIAGVLSAGVLALVALLLVAIFGLHYVPEKSQKHVMYLLAGIAIITLIFFISIGGIVYYLSKLLACTVTRVCL